MSTPADLPKTLEHFIGGTHVPSATGATFDVADPVSNQPYATVAARWSAPELRQLLAARRNVRGEPISISHLVLLARLSNPARDQWTERVFDEGLTVRQLRELLRNESQD